MKKKLTAMMVATAMIVSLTACGGSSESTGGTAAQGDTGKSAADASASEESPSEAPASDSAAGSGVSITIFNSKSEIQDQFEVMAEEYSAATGVDVEVYYSSDTVAAHLATRYSANDPYTISMVDAKDVYSLGAEHATDLSDQEWVGNTDYAISVDGKVLGFPVCIEARGLMYNASAIEAITGETFNPDDYATLDAFQELLEKLVAGGMSTPTGIMKEDWSLGAHYLAQVYEEHSDVEAFIDSLRVGGALSGDSKWNSLMDTFDTLMKYNYAASSPVAAEREVSEQKLAEGEIAFMFGGNWDWSLIKDFDYSEKMGMMPVPQNTSDGTNKKLVGGGSKYFFIDSSDNTSDEQREAAKAFLNWLVFDEAGNKFMTESCALVPAYSNISAESLDPLSISVKAYADAGNLVPNYDYLPDDHYSICGASFQKYMAQQVDREGLAAEIESYWASATPVEH